jgi:hypothetical protein
MEATVKQKLDRNATLRSSNSTQDDEFTGFFTHQVQTLHGSNMREQLGKSFQFDSIYTDFKKAFDLIDPLKLSKLPKCDISGPPLDPVDRIRSGDR